MSTTVIIIIIAVIVYLAMPTLRKKFPRVFPTHVIQVSDLFGKNKIKNFRWDIAYLSQLESEALNEMDSGNYDAALQKAEKAIEIGDKSAYIIQGLCLADMDFNLDAIDSFTKAIEYNPEKSDLYFLRAGSKILSGDYPGAAADKQAIFELIKANTEFNRTETAYANNEGYGSLNDKYVALFNELESAKPQIEAEGFNLKRRPGTKL